MTDDILYSTIAELADLLKDRKISSLELTKAYLDRLEQLGPKYNALATLMRKPAEKAAKEADDNFKRGRVRSPLQGIPYGAKDLLATKGVPTTWGAEPYGNQVFDYDATVIQKLEKTGAILAAKLAMVQLAGGGGYRYPSASMYGPGKNPWNPAHWSGGSSSGSGAAVAAAMVSFALGSETSGSILTPSSYCGVTGLRPTYGLVSRYGAMALSWTLDKIGPLCRSAEDCALVLHAISGRDSSDPASAGKSFYYLKEYGRPLSELRIGYWPADFSERAVPAARPAFQAALEVIKKLGPKMVEASLPPMPYGDVIGTIIASEGSTIFESLIRSDKFDRMPDERQKAGLRAGLETPARDYLNAMRIRRLIQEKFRQLFVDADVLLSFTRPGPASGVDEPLDRGAPPPTAAPKSETKTGGAPPQGNAALIPAANLAGLPAISLPCGFSTDSNLPLAIQLVSRPFDELTLVTLGREFQKQTDWHRKRPPIPA